MSIYKKLNGGSEENSHKVNWSWVREREKYSVKYLIAKSKLTFKRYWSAFYEYGREM